MVNINLGVAVLAFGMGILTATAYNKDKEGGGLFFSATIFEFLISGVYIASAF